MKALLIFLAKALLKLAMDEALRRALPQVYNRLDAEIPVLLTQHMPPSRVESVIASAIADAVGKPASATQVEAVLGLYDPIRAALNRRR